MAATSNCGAALKAIFTGNAGVSALIGTRFYPYRNTPQNTAFPYGSWLETSLQNVHHMTAAAGVQMKTYQVDWVSKTYDEAVSLANLARLAADGKRGTITIGADTFTLKMLHLADEQEIHDPIEAGEAHYFRISQDWRIGFAVAVPTF